jgi:hypothetical protein
MAQIAAAVVKKVMYPQNLVYPSSGTPARSTLGTAPAYALPVEAAITFLRLGVHPGAGPRRRAGW